MEQVIRSPEVEQAFQALRSSIARVIINQKTVGACFLISQEVALTSRHLFSNIEDSKITVRFEVTGEERSVEIDCPKDVSIDLCVLRLDKPVSGKPFTLTNIALWGEPFLTFGYPKGQVGHEYFGKTLGPTSTDSGATRLELHCEAERISQGCSGGPVWVIPKGELPGFIVGCIAETGSKENPDRPTCAGIGTLLDAEGRFAEYMENLVSEIEEPESSWSAPLTADDPSSIWRVTAEVTKPHQFQSLQNGYEKNIARIATNIHQEISAKLQKSRSADQPHKIELTAFIEGLKLKYRELDVDIDSLQFQISKLRSSRHYENFGDCRFLLAQIRMVNEDISRIPSYYLRYASNHGLDLHSTVENGYSFGIIKEMTPDLVINNELDFDDYGWENIERLVLSVQNLLEFDTDLLSEGFLDGGWEQLSTPSKKSIYLALATRKISEAGLFPSIDIYQVEESGLTKQVAGLLARKLQLYYPKVQASPEGNWSILAVDAYHLYIWINGSPIPFIERPIGGLPKSDTFSGVKFCFLEENTQGWSFLVLYSNGELLRLDSNGLRRIVDLDVPAYSQILLDPTNYHLKCLNNAQYMVGVDDIDLNKGNIINIGRIGEDDVFLGAKQTAGKLKFEEIGERSWKKLNDWFKNRNDQSARNTLLIKNAQILEQNKSFLVASIFSQHNNWFLIDIRDFHTMAQATLPILTDQHIFELKSARFDGRTHIICSMLAGTGTGTNHFLSAWEISEDGQPPTRLGLWHPTPGGDALYLQVIESKNGWDAYYVTSINIVSALQGGAGIKRGLWRFSWPSCEIKLLVEFSDSEPVSLDVVKLNAS